MKKLLLLSLLILVIILPGSFAKQKSKTGGRYTPVTKFDASRDSENDLCDAIKEAKRSNRKILLDIGGDWCPWCRKLEKFFDENKDVSNYLNKHFVVVKINYDKEHKNEKFLSKFPKVDGYPHLFVLSKKGKLLHSQNTGDLESGDHHDRDKVFSFLKKWGSK